MDFSEEDLIRESKTVSIGYLRLSLLEIIILENIINMGILAITHILPLWLWATFAKNNLYTVGGGIFLIGTVFFGVCYGNEIFQSFRTKCKSEKKKHRIMIQIKKATHHE